MEAFMYDRLAERAKIVKPYRTHPTYKGMKRWPILSRTHSHKYYAEREENGQIVYDIYYDYWYEYKRITTQEYNALPPSEQSKWWLHPVNQWTPEAYYSRHDAHHHRVAVSRPDGTIEVVAQHLGQGVRMVLQEMGTGYYQQSVKHDGAIWRLNSAGDVIPMFKGMKFTMVGRTPLMHESSRYEVVTRKVSRSAGRELMSKYANFLTVSSTMFKVMDTKGFIDQLMEVARHVAPDRTQSQWTVSEKRKEFEAYAESVMESDPVGAALAYMIAYSVQWARSFATQGTNTWNVHRLNEDIPTTYFQAMKKKFSADMYSKHDNVFEKVTHSCEKRHFPSNDWAIDVLVNGKEVERY